ncbi:hypothetical protein F5Y17DRAFT_404377 [Xylariaceae sp. FL0594]|nr:hypothetical protein F5Y17DRAFT_404377 [Xylariaceae sp. FL0594]
MPDGSLLFSPAPYHILSYGALLGTQFFHTFINSILSFKVLERPQFAILQRAVFPAYFGIQTTAPIVLALTYPGGEVGGRLAGLNGVLHPTNRWGVLVPLTTAFVTGLTNWIYLLPETNKVTAQRRRQEVKDGKQSWDKGSHSKEMAALNAKFSQLHGISSLLNLVTFIATVVYGVHLAARIE